MAGRANTQERERQKAGRHSEIIGTEYSGTNPMAATRAAVNRKIRQDTLREYMQERGSTQYLFDLIEKIEGLDPSEESFSSELAKYKAAAELRYKLIGKYLPDLKSQEITGEGGDALQIKVADFKNA